jgi:hypothetical protein
MIQAILNEDHRGDVAGDIVEFGHLMVCFLAITPFLQMSPLFFTPTMIFAILSFLLIFVFPLSFFNDLQLKSFTDTCYGAPVGSLTVLPLPRFRLAQDADGEEGLPEAGAAQPAAGPRAPLAAAAATFAAGASASTAAAGAAASTSAPGPSTFDDPSGHGPHSSFPLSITSTQVCAPHLASVFLIWLQEVGRKTRWLS